MALNFAHHQQKTNIYSNQRSMTISSVHNSFRWLVAPLVGLLLLCQILAICIVPTTMSSLHSPSDATVHFQIHDHCGTQQLSSSGGAQDADLVQQSVSTPAPSISVLAVPDQSSPHIAEHNCCDNNEDALRAMIFLVFAVAIILFLIRIAGAPNIACSGAARNLRPSEDGYPRPHLVFCRLLN